MHFGVGATEGRRRVSRLRFCSPATVEGGAQAWACGDADSSSSSMAERAHLLCQVPPVPTYESTTTAARIAPGAG
jgi:hypothetical protein